LQQRTASRQPEDTCHLNKSQMGKLAGTGFYQRVKKPDGDMCFDRREVQ